VDRVLFVDDEPFVLRALRRTFEMEGYEVATAAGPAEALDLLRAGKEFQVIGSDYRMPDMNGAEFLQQARQIAPQSFRLLISAVEEFGAAVDAINRGEIHRLIPKPWNRDELVAIVRTAAEDYHLRRRYSEMTALLHTKNAALETLNRELEHRVEEHTNGLLQALVTALDQRAAESVHSRRAALWCRRLAQQLGLSAPEIATLERAATVHDLGKIAVPDAILQKSGPLTDQEWIEMKRHPELGYRLLAGIPMLDDARRIVLQHHERFDGSGYPLGVRGEEIHLGARIFHLVESYDAMREQRTYRQARTDVEARAEIARCTGTQFDPQVVAAFQAIPSGEWELATACAQQASMPSDPALDDLRRRSQDGKL
jgi:response regulator RpfG family c-di-GMP phosphodiesterase